MRNLMSTCTAPLPRAIGVALEVELHVRNLVALRRHLFLGDAQPALVIGRHYITEGDSAPVQYNGIV